MNEMLFSQVFPNWSTKRVIGSGSYGKVYELERVEEDAVYRSALKVITIPQSDDEIRSRLAEGESRESVAAYYHDVARTLLSENRVMAELKGNSNIVSYEDHQVIDHEDGIGVDILIRMELLTSFIDYMADHEIDEDTVIRLGIDICKALEICERKNIIHRDIKPGNVFVSDTEDFKLGDFGIARTIDKTLGGLSKKGTYRYMAPEVYKGESYGRTVDICSLGLVMYYLMNGNRTPFLPDAPAQITFHDEEDALIRRMRGERMAPPRFASNELAFIILKACAYRDWDRYPSAEAMRKDLEALRDGNFRIPSAARRPERSATAAAAAHAGQTAAGAATAVHRAPPQAQMPRMQGTDRTAEYFQDRNKKKQVLIIGIAAGVLALAIILALAITLSGRHQERDIDQEIPPEETESYVEEEVVGVTEDEAKEYVFAHRNGNVDEDIFADYDESIDEGAIYIEQDVVLGDNGELYVSYNQGLSADFEAQGKPRLAEVFDRYGENVYYLVEVKQRDEATVRAFINLVNDYGYEDQVIAQCFEDWVLRDIRDAFPGMTTLYLVDVRHGGQSALEGALQMDYVDYIAVSDEDGLMTRTNCEKVHSAGKSFCAWLLNDSNSIRRAIELGLDAYFTCEPSLAIELEMEYRNEE